MNGHAETAGPVLVTGWGLVAQAVAATAADRGLDVLTVSRTTPEAPGFARLDLAQETDALVGLVRRWAPSVVIHTAAMTSVARCQLDVRGAYAANVAASESVARAAREAGAHLLAFSTDWVFDGATGGYAEDDPIGPRNVYGLTKAWGERSALRDGGTVLRATFVGRRPDERPGLVERLLDPAYRARVPAGKRASPLWVGHAASAALDLAVGRVAGLVHLGSRESIGWGELAEMIRPGGAGVEEVEIDDGIDRPADTSLAVDRAESLLGRRLPTVSETVGAMLAAAPLAPAGVVA